MEPKNLREIGSDQLERILSFFERAEAKASFLFALDAGLLALIALNVRPSSFDNWYVVLPGVLSVLLIVCSFWFIYRCHFPELEGGKGSLIYFVEIAKRTEAEFVAECEGADEAKFSREYLGQIWRNAYILTAKFRYLRTAYVLTGLALLPWFVFLMAVSLMSSQLLTVR